MAISRTSVRTSLRRAMVFALSVATVGLLLSFSTSTAVGAQVASAAQSAFANTYPWDDAACIDGTGCSGPHNTYNWGYPLTNGKCPPKDPSCLTYPYYPPKSKTPTAGMGDTWKFGVKNCTSYVAWMIHQTMHIDIGDWGNAADWSDATHPSHPPAGSVHSAVSYTPVVGDIAQWTTIAPPFGHVAYVYAVNNGVASLAEYNGLGNGKFTDYRTTAADSVGRPTNYIHLGTGGSETGLTAYAGKIVQWNNGPNKPMAAWLVSFDLKRYWIPDGSVYQCLTSRGFAVAGPQPATVLNQLRDQTGHWASCGSNTLSSNQYLFRGSSLISSNGQYHLELQRSDGNLVLYGPTGAALWDNKQSSDYLVMQPDGNLATYTTGGGVTWASNTGKSGANYLVVGYNGNLGLYTLGGARVWAILVDSQLVSAKATDTPAPAPRSPATATPTPTPTPPPTPTPAPGKSIQIGWSSAHPTWIWMTFNGFTPGTYTYACTFSTPPQSFPYTIVETTEPQTWDNGHTCYDTQAGDHIWVVVNGVSSNTLTVGSSSPPTPTPTTAPTWTEQEGDLGANSFSNPHNASGMGPHLNAYTYVQVSCKLYDPTIQSVNPDGYWYLIASAPWSNHYYVAANTFWNGDIPGQKPYTHNTDWNVPNC